VVDVFDRLLLGALHSQHSLLDINSQVGDLPLGLTASLGAALDV